MIGLSGLPHITEYLSFILPSIINKTGTVSDSLTETHFTAENVVQLTKEDILRTIASVDDQFQLSNCVNKKFIYCLSSST